MKKILSAMLVIVMLFAVIPFSGVTKASAMETVAGSYDYLWDCIDKYGIDANGKKVLPYKLDVQNTTGVWFISKDTKNNLLEFVSSYLGIEVVMYIEKNTANYPVFINGKVVITEYEGKVVIDPKSYYKNKKYYFNITPSDSMYDSVQKSFRSQFHLAISGWEIILNAYGLSLANFGFTGAGFTPYKVPVTTTEYTVTYNANDGSVSPASASIESGKSVILPTPTRSGYTCLGWSTSSTATSATYKCGTSYMPNANVTLYAVWKADSTPSSVSASSSFTVDTRNTTSLKVKWSAVSGASGYQLQRKKTINGKLEWTDVANTTSTSYTINSLSAGTLYYLRVRTYKTVNGSKQYSSWKTLTTCTKPSTPSAPSVDTRATTSLKIKWNTVNKATSYEIQRKKTVNGKLEWVSLGTTKNLNYMISSLAAGTCYYIRVRAIRTLDNGNKYYSDWSKTLTTCTKPSATANFKVDSRTTTSLKLKWDAVSWATSYEVQRKKTVNGELVWVSLGTTTNKNFTISGLSAGTLYYVRVRAIRTLDNGNKYYSDWKNITTCTNPSAVKNLKVDSVQSNSVKLKWDKVSKATNYEVQQKKIVNGKATWVLLDIPTATSYNIKALSSKTTYNFRVRAFRKLDNGNKYFSEWKEITVKTK